VIFYFFLATWQKKGWLSRYIIFVSRKSEGSRLPDYVVKNTEFISSTVNVIYLFFMIQLINTK